MNPVVLPELRYRRLWFGAGMVIAAVILIVCLLPGNKLPELKNISDKTEHMLAFATLAFWFGSILVRRDIVWLALALVAFGGLIELAQATMKLGRQGDVNDLIADAIGVAVGIALALTPLGRWARWVENHLRTRARS